MRKRNIKNLFSGNEDDRKVFIVKIMIITILMEVARNQ